MSLPEPETSTQFQGLTFKSYGSSLTYQNQRFDPNLSEYMPKRNKNGSLSARRPKYSRSTAYWKAQCAFRGLPTKKLTKIAEFQDLLNGKESLKQANELTEFEQKAEDEWNTYWKKCDELEETIAKKEDDRLQEEAVNTLKNRFLEKKEKGTPEGIVVKNVASQWRFKKAADTLGLPYVSVNAIVDGDISCDTHKWMIFGGQNGEALKKKQEIEDGFQRAKDEKVRKKKKAIEDAQNRVKAVRDDMVKFSEGNNGAWDVTGKWRINCPYIETNYPGENGKRNYTTMEIFITPSNSKEKDMWAKFNFSIMAGVIRFLRHGNPTSIAGKGKSEDTARAGDKRKRNTYDHDENDSEHDSDKNDEVPDPAFKIPINSHPSSKNATWQYRMRSREMNADGGLGYILSEEDTFISEITFGGLAGETLSGTIESTLFGKESFTGVKIGKGTSPSQKVWKEWKRLGEEAYDNGYRRW